ncbi:hypothetical protein SY83_20385 [Paenibacillus swuensis]|uniref:ABC transporter substrate-binding protein n=1 Tax=Paenibacillus swuensis TaxID=1178515 RepID=A0A172TMR1_9BACL|nr:extracellular solute-binding protein [Paenibacillus swuensis]ANE48256.1 hypothetical protein SY83_20385 [Paenibacillus swuensis]
MNQRGQKLASILLVTTLFLTACGANTGSPAATETNGGDGASAVEKKQVALKIWGGVPEESGPKDVVTAWNNANPDIQVEYVRYVNDDSGNTKLDTALVSQSDPPDLFFSYGETYLNRRIHAGMTIELDDLIDKSGLKVDEVIGNANIVKTDGKTHYLPAMKQISAILMNKTVLDAAGEKVPDSWTWDEYTALALKLTKSGMAGSFIQNPGETIQRFTLITSKPKDFSYKEDGTSNFDSAALRKGLELQKELYDKGAMVKWAETITNKLAPQSELFTGKAAMVFGGTHLIRYVKDLTGFPRDFQVVFAPTPQYQKGTNVNVAGFNDFMSINKNSKHKEKAMKFMTWYLTEGNNLMIPGGRIPSNKKADMDKVVEQVVGDAAAQMDIDSLKKVLKADYVYPAQTISTAFPALTTILNEESEKYFMNVQDLDKTMSALKTRADDAIESVKK